MRFMPHRPPAHLAVIHPQHGEGHAHAPGVPLLRHAHFDGHQAGALRAAVQDALLQRRRRCRRRRAAAARLC